MTATTLTPRQQHQIERWLARPDIARLDVVPINNHSVTCHMFSLAGKHKPEMIELALVATVWYDGIYEIHAPTQHEYETIRPIDEEG